MVLIQDMLREIPPVTKIICSSSLLVQLLVYIQAISKYDLYFSLSHIFGKFQIWRLFTSFLYLGDSDSIQTFFSLMMLFQCSTRLEERTFRNKAADYLYFLLLGVTVMIGYASIVGFTNLSKSFLTMLLYVWSRYNQDVIMLIFGFLPIKAPYITWVYIVVDIILEEFIAYDILGVFIAHVFYFLYEIYPRLPLSKGLRAIKTPNFLVKFVDYAKLTPNEYAGYYDD